MWVVPGECLWSWWRLSLLVLLYMVGSARGMSILIFGDSFDRYLVMELCESQGQKYATWSDNRLTYQQQQGIGDNGALRCVLSPNDTISNVQLFGSNATRPYYHDGYFTTRTNLIDTKVRMTYAFRRYLQLYPAPDVVLFNTLAWDVQYFSTQGAVWFTVNTIGHEDFHRAIAHTRQEIVDRMAELHALLVEYRLDNHTRLGLRSGFYYPSRYSSTKCEKDVKYLIEGYNDMYRALTREKNWLFFDLDANVWSTTRYTFNECDVLRDSMHTNTFYSVLCAQKLMGMRYTPFYWLRGEQPLPANWASSWLHPTTRQIQTKVYLVKLLSGSSPVVDRHQRHSSLHLHGNSTSTSTTDTDTHRSTPGTSLKYFSNGTLAAQYLLEEEQFAQDLYFVTYDKTGQTPMLHLGAGVHFQTLFVLGEGDIYEATVAELHDLRRGHEVPAAMNTAGVSERGVIVHIPIAKAANSARPVGDTSDAVEPQQHHTAHRYLRHHNDASLHNDHHRRRRRLAATIASAANEQHELSREQLPETLAIFGETVDAAINTTSTVSATGRGSPTHTPTVAPSTGSVGGESDDVSVCDQWYLLLRGRKHPLHLIADYVDRCKDSASRALAARLPLNRIYERFATVTLLAGRERCRVHDLSFLSLLAEGNVIPVP